MLHGDLHHDNILYDEVRGWLAIDPKGYLGEPVYEAGAWLRNPMQYPKLFASHEIISCRTAMMNKELGWDQKRILKWSYEQAILAAIWADEDGADSSSHLMIAEIMRDMISH